MAKEERNYNKEFKRLGILNYIIMLLLLVLIILTMVTSCKISKEEETSDYDVSMMREVGVDDVLELFDDKDTYVLYIGRETCDICQELLPALQTAQLENNYITQYLDITAVDRSSDEWEELVEKLDVETTKSLSADGIGEKVTDTFGYFLDEKGFTPCVIVISNGKMVAGFFGNKSLTSLEDWLEEYGV